jgi:hypothetical protein
MRPFALFLGIIVSWLRTLMRYSNRKLFINRFFCSDDYVYCMCDEDCCPSRFICGRIFLIVLFHNRITDQDFINLMVLFLSESYLSQRTQAWMNVKEVYDLITNIFCRHLRESDGAQSAVVLVSQAPPLLTRALRREKILPG